MAGKDLTVQCTNAQYYRNEHRIVPCYVSSNKL